METKIAIKVNNEREFKAIQKYWKSKGIRLADFDYKIYKYIPHMLCGGNADPYDYTIIDFPIFAAIVGIDVVNEVIIELTNGSIAIVNKDGVKFNFNKISGIGITSYEFDEIYTAYKSLGE